MSSDLTSSFDSQFSNGNPYTNIIRDIFNEHWITLHDERNKLIDEIDEWYMKQEKAISSYANKQKTLINEYYNRLRPILSKEFRENQETANSYYAAQEYDPFNELKKACQSLKYSVAKLEFVIYECQYPEVTNAESDRKSKTFEERDTARRRRRNNGGNDNNTESINDTKAVLSPEPESSTVEEKDSQQSSKRKSGKTKKKVQSTENTDNLKDEVLNGDQSEDKCPICYMIFPLSMTIENREQHTNEHYADD